MHGHNSENVFQTCYTLMRSKNLKLAISKKNFRDFCGSFIKIYSHGMKFRHFVEIITKTIPLRLISLSKPNVVWACYLVEIYSLTIQLQILGLGINN